MYAKQLYTKGSTISIALDSSANEMNPQTKEKVTRW